MNILAFESSCDETAVAVLRQGAKGGEVKEVQRRLKLWGYYNGTVDGVFGASTKPPAMASSNSLMSSLASIVRAV